MIHKKSGTFGVDYQLKQFYDDFSTLTNLNLFLLLLWNFIFTTLRFEFLAHLSILIQHQLQFYLFRQIFVIFNDFLP